MKIGVSVWRGVFGHRFCCVLFSYSNYSRQSQKFFFKKEKNPAHIGFDLVETMKTCKIRFYLDLVSRECNSWLFPVYVCTLPDFLNVSSYSEKQKHSSPPTPSFILLWKTDRWIVRHPVCNFVFYILSFFFFSIKLVWFTHYSPLMLQVEQLGFLLVIADIIAF